MIDKPGMFFDMPPEEYFADPCPRPSLTNSLIGVLLNQSPAHAASRHPRLNGGVDTAREQTQQMCVGSVVHRLALDAGKDYAVIDADSYRTNDAKAQRAEAEAAGKVPILAANFDKAQEQAKVIRQHLDDVLLGEPFVSEVVIAWKIATKHGEIWCRGMVDAWCPSLKMAVDLKTSTDASLKAATNKMAREGYDTQSAWYSTGLGHLIGEPGRVRFTYLFCETEAPYASQPFELDEAWRSSGWDLCEEAADTFARCLKRNQWPGYSRNPVLLTPPDWLIRERMFRSFGTGHEHSEAA